MNGQRDKPHALEVERWLLDEQDESERASVEQRLSSDEQARLRLEDAALRDQLTSELPAGRFAGRVRERAQQLPRPRAPAARFALPALLVLAVMLFWRPLAPDERGQEGAPTSTTERAKGRGLELHVYRRQGDRAELLHDGARASAGDVLQLGYLRAGYEHGVLLSIDGRGGVTLHHPRAGGVDDALGVKSGEQLLAEAYELDDAPLFERFVLVVSQEPLDVPAILRSARELAADPSRARSALLSLRIVNEQRSVLVEKSSPR